MSLPSCHITTESFLRDRCFTKLKETKYLFSFYYASLLFGIFFFKVFRCSKAELSALGKYISFQVTWKSTKAIDPLLSGQGKAHEKVRHFFVCANASAFCDYHLLQQSKNREYFSLKLQGFFHHSCAGKMLERKCRCSGWCNLCSLKELCAQPGWYKSLSFNELQIRHVDKNFNTYHYLNCIFILIIHTSPQGCGN